MDLAVLLLVSCTDVILPAGSSAVVGGGVRCSSLHVPAVMQLLVDFLCCEHPPEPLSQAATLPIAPLSPAFQTGCRRQLQADLCSEANKRL